MIKVKKSQNEVEEILDPVITDEFDTSYSPEITKLQAEIIRERMSDLIKEKESKKKYLQNMKKINILKYINSKKAVDNIK